MSSEREEVALPEVAKTPCNECPWRRDSLSGHLGPHGPETWVELAHSEAAIACHKTITNENWDDPGMRQCSGAAIFRKNVLKLPRRHDVARATEPDHERIFSNNEEFIAHHRRHDG